MPKRQRISKSERKVLLNLFLVTIPSLFIILGLQGVIMEYFPSLETNTVMFAVGVVWLLAVFYFFTINKTK